MFHLSHCTLTRQSLRLLGTVFTKPLGSSLLISKIPLPTMSTRRSARLSSQAAETPMESNTARKRKAPSTGKEAVDEKPKQPKRKIAAKSGAKISKPAEPETTAETVKEDPEFVVPKTPNKRRTAASAANGTPTAPPPFTPTPSAVGLIAHSKAQNPSAHHGTRGAEPHATNAPLSTPGGSRYVAFPSSSPSKLPKTTTDTLLEDAKAHLIKIDPTLKDIIEKHHCKLFSPEGLQEEIDPFVALSSSIMAQQVSGAAASSIKRKFIGLFPDCTTFPTPAQVAAEDVPFLRTAGLSQRKAEYIKGLAEKFASGELSAKMLVEASDEEVMEKLVAVRGLGKWSVEMFACFGLKRMDVLSTGDLGVQKGMAAYMGKDVAKLKGKGGKWKYMSEADMLKHSADFAPYRSLFMWYMWRFCDVDVKAISGE
ncbi:DNA glycosylase [Aulographum hederae CBS 113979]|uniref:DNA glycosylase n=1 Tax=Aulographum hederae CBS 113979 TaxID=1176131 RepID=A0A6G1H4W1_9PEZI|nr:DNA glycosylase [Aulographum hederae CBS 113979]